jgi:predicted transposase/invertase (TIGR01784 family)
MIIKDKYIDPFTDFGFKHIFGTEENKHFLISFLNDLLDIEDKIINLEYRNLEKLGLNIVDRRAVFDVYCTDEKNNNFIVELQRSKQKYFKDRSLYYTSFPIQQQSKRGDWDYRLKKIFFVGILDFTLDDDYLTEVQLKDGNNEVFYDKLKYYYLQMPNFKKQEKELSNHLEYWLYYLNHLADSQSIPEILAEDKLITEAFHIAEFLALDEDEQFAYQQDLKARLDYKNVMDYAKEEAEKEGIVLGIAQGITQGITQGIEKGREKEKIAVAKKLLDVLEIEIIAKKTGLSIEVIKDLK